MTQTNTKASTTITVRVDVKLKERLEVAAANQNRSNSFVIGEAITDYLHIQELQDAGVRAAIASADRGEFIEHSRVKAWVESLGTENELPMPTPLTK